MIEGLLDKTYNSKPVSPALRRYPAGLRPLSLISSK